MFKSLLIQIKTHPLGSFFLITTYSVCILALSLGLSYSTYAKQSDLDFNNGTPDHISRKTINFSDSIDFEKFIKLSETTGENAEVQIFKQGLSITKSETANMTAVYYKILPEYIVPILDGRYFNQTEIDKGAKVAVIGKALDKNTYTKGDEKYINIGDDTFKIIGTVGRTKNSDTFASSLYIPLKALSTSMQATINEDMQLSVLIRKNGIKPTSESKAFNEGILQMDPDATIENEKTISTSFGNDRLKNTIFEILLMLVIGIINVANISVFWILDRTKEIAVKKTFGAGNYTLGYEILKEMLALSLTGALISILLQYGMNYFIGDLFKFSIVPSLANFILILLLSVICGFIVTFIILRNVMKMQPAAVLKS
jgi:putative ABC transport system permease protein